MCKQSSILLTNERIKKQNTLKLPKLKHDWPFIEHEREDDEIKIHNTRKLLIFNVFFHFDSHLKSFDICSSFTILFVLANFKR